MSQPRTIIIFPGWGGSHETWEPFMNLARRDFTVHCIDMPCFGGVPCPNEAWGVDEYAEYAFNAVKQLKLADKPILLGHSFGGQVATRVMADHSDFFSALVLVAPAIIRPSRRLRRAFFYLIAKTGKFLFRLPIIEKGSLWARRVLYRAANSPDYSKTSEIQRDIFRKIIRQDMRQYLEKVTVPTLVLWGTLDAFTPFRDSKKVMKHLKNATLVVFDKGTHGLHLHKTEEAYSALTSFTQRLT